MRRLAILLAALLTISAAPALTEAQVRDFLARQERAWNRGDLAGYFAGFTPGATFTDRAYAGDKPLVVYGTSTLTEARRQSRGAAKAREAGQAVRIVIAPDGRSAQVVSHVRSEIASADRVRRLCAVRAQTLMRAGGSVRATGQTDPNLPCPLLARAVTPDWLNRLGRR
jgi:hypothetical protein